MDGDKILDDYIARVKTLEDEVALLQQVRAELMTSKWWLIFAGSTILFLFGLFFGIKGLWEIDTKIDTAIIEAGIEEKVDLADEILKRALIESATSVVWVQYDCGRIGSGIQAQSGIKAVTPNNGNYIVEFERTFQSRNYAAVVYTNDTSMSVSLEKQTIGSITVKTKNGDGSNTRGDKGAFSLVLLGRTTPVTPQTVQRNLTKP